MRRVRQKGTKDQRRDRCQQAIPLDNGTVARRPRAR
ncbi:hypothetical protein BH11GEM2_BH11GEM2_06950 [soil metagenome]